MTDINFQPIFDYIDESFNPVKQQLDRLENRVGNLETAVANLSAQVKTYHEEMIILVHRVDRNEKWMKQVSEKLNIPVPF